MIRPPRLGTLVVSSAVVGAAWLFPPDVAGQGEPPAALDGVRYRERTFSHVLIRHRAADSLLADAVAELLAVQPPLPGLADSLPAGVSVYLAHTARALDELTGGRVPEWRAGVAIPATATLILPTGEGRSPLGPEGRRVLRHEWAHLGLHQAVGGARIPRWFDEGYAQWVSGWDATEAWKLRVLIALGRTPPLDSLSLRWPRDRTDAEAAYLLAASAVAYLLEESGERGMRALVTRWRQGRSFDAALRVTFGVTVGQFEEGWRRHAKKRYGWLFVLSHSAVFWALMALVLLLLVRIRRRRDRERMARLRASDEREPRAAMDGGPGAVREGYPGHLDGRS